METLIIELENKFTGKLMITKEYSTNATQKKERFIKHTKSMKWLMGDWNVSRCYIETK
jgi:hypothetical protein